MQKTFTALEARHPGCKVKGIKFSVDPSKVDGKPIDMDAFDASLAETITHAKETSLEEVMDRGFL